MSLRLPLCRATMSLPPAKRKRMTAPKKHAEFWFSDGSVVLQAGNTQFRVHWSLLARHSAIFRDMQGLPQPADEPTIDGCPVVKLPDDPSDVELLLKGLYDSAFLGREKLSLAAIGAFIRLGRKYQFEDILDSAVARVMAKYPTTLSKYGATTELELWRSMEGYEGIEFDVITLLSDNNIFTALPSAYYRAVNSASMLFDGIPRKDGTRACLAQVDLRRCAIGQQNLFIKQFEPGYTFGWFREWDFEDDCTSLQSCRKEREGFLALYMDDSRPFALVELNFKFHDFCDACARHATDCMNAGRKKIWEELPQMFDLPPWDQLKNDL
ncbi:hypothetical protein C8R45DRAFT_807261 [Mycena sanguinolenta]|nr:hypothetical protein C8R45DRAFT_807261 [Mycena sanguinolenta]